MSNPSPLSMPKQTVCRPIVAPVVHEKMPSREQIAASIEPTTQAKVVRPSGTKRTVLVTQADDGVRKAKQLHHGQRVRPFLKGEARGGVRVVDQVERLDDGAIVRISYSSGHPTVEVKAAYRFVDIDAIGKPVQVRVHAEPSFVPVH